MTSMRPLVVKGRIEPMGNEYFYEAACCQAPFPLCMSVTPSVVNRASGFLKREASVCLERTSILPASFPQTPNALFAQRRFGKRREAEGGANPSMIFRQSASVTCFYRKS